MDRDDIPCWVYRVVFWFLLLVCVRLLYLLAVR